MGKEHADTQALRSTPSPGPQHRRRAWFIGGGATAVTFLVCLNAFGLWTYVNADHLGILNDPSVISVVEPACAKMAAAVRQVPVPPPGAPPAQVAAAIRSQNDAVRTLTKAVRALGNETLNGDDPAQAWLSDWDTLIVLRERYATDLLAGRTASFTLPTIDGVPITQRMSDPGVACPVPPALTALQTTG